MTTTLDPLLWRDMEQVPLKRDAEPVTLGDLEMLLSAQGDGGKTESSSWEGCDPIMEKD